MNSAAIISEIGRVCRFFSIGMIATGAHIALCLTLVTGLGVAEQSANFTSFMFALGISFFGHYIWTFQSTATYNQVLPRFLGVAFAGYFASAALLFALQGVEGLPSVIRLVVAALLIPTVSYLAYRFLVFDHDN